MSLDQQVLSTLRQVVHPELERDLVKLGMIKDVDVQDGKVTLTLALPFIDVPVKEDLVRTIKKVLAKMDSTLHVQVEPVEMTQKERAAFMAVSGEGEMRPASLANDIARAVAVLSGKGGVGKSSAVAMLAVALRRREVQVGV